MSCFFDTNVLVYVFDRAEPRKQALAQALIAEHMQARAMVLSTQVLQELYVTLTRKKQLSAADALEVTTTFAQERVVAANADTVLRALALGAARQLSAWDALIVQAALDAGCSTLFSEDFQTGARFDGLVVVDPFAMRAHEPVAPYRSRSAQR